MPDVVLKYKGGGFIPCVPARDLTEEDIAALNGLGINKRVLLGSGLYTEVRQPKPVPAANNNKKE